MVEKREIINQPENSIVDALVANTIDDLGLTFTRLNSSGIGDDTNAVMGAFKAIDQISNIGLALGSGKTTFKQMHGILSPLTSSKTKLPHGSKDRFHQFVDDLEILSIFEEEGIEGINQRLDTILSQLQKGKLPLKEQQQSMIEANQFLYRAIYLFPHLVSSIEVKLDESATDNTDEINREYRDARRYQFEESVTERIAINDEDPNTLVIPLPYGFSTGTHGSGSRSAAAQSRREVYFSIARKKGAQKEYSPVLKATIRLPILSSHETTFLTKEVKSVRLSHRQDFTPYFDDYHKDGPLIDRGDHLTYYLRFREFSNYQSGQLVEGEQKPIILEPFKNINNLWDDKYRQEGHLLNKGLLVVWQDRPENMTMYEIKNYQFSQSDNDKKQIALMYEAIISGKTSSRKFSGDEIITHLSQIPVSPRRF